MLAVYGARSHLQHVTERSLLNLNVPCINDKCTHTLKVSAHVGSRRRDMSQRHEAATKLCVVHTERTCNRDVKQGHVAATKITMCTHARKYSEDMSMGHVPSCVLIIFGACNTNSCQAAHTVGAYPGFRSIKRLGIFLLPPECDASPLQGSPPALCRRYPFIHLGGERHYESKVSCPRTQHKWPGLELGPLDPESGALTIRPPRLPLIYMYNVT